MYIRIYTHHANDKVSNGTKSGWGLNKMADNFKQMTFETEISWMLIIVSWSKFDICFKLKGPIENILALIEAIPWLRTEDRPLPETMLTTLSVGHYPNQCWINGVIRPQLFNQCGALY